jgi:hypothetical protein
LLAAAFAGDILDSRKLYGKEWKESMEKNSAIVIELWFSANETQSSKTTP